MFLKVSEQPLANSVKETCEMMADNKYGYDKCIGAQPLKNTVTNKV